MPQIAPRPNPRPTLELRQGSTPTWVMGLLLVVFVCSNRSQSGPPYLAGHLQINPAPVLPWPLSAMEQFPHFPTKWDKYSHTHRPRILENIGRCLRSHLRDRLIHCKRHYSWSNWCHCSKLKRYFLSMCREPKGPRQSPARIHTILLHHTLKFLLFVSSFL